MLLFVMYRPSSTVCHQIAGPDGTLERRNAAKASRKRRLHYVASSQPPWAKACRISTYAND